MSGGARSQSSTSSSCADLCSVFRELAQWTWSRLEAANRCYMPFNEETITDYLLLELAARCPNRVKVIPFTKAREKEVGADWEWWFYNRPNGIGCRVQAKLLNRKTLRYESLKFRPRGSSQTDVLILSSSSDNLIPMFCFYGFDGRGPLPAGLFYSPLQGCSVAHASNIRAISSKYGGVVIPHTIPWHELVCSPSGVGSSLEQIAGHIADLTRPSEYEPELIRRLPPYVINLILERKRGPELDGSLGSRDKPDREFPIRGVVAIRVDEG